MGRPFGEHPPLLFYTRAVGAVTINAIGARPAPRRPNKSGERERPWREHLTRSVIGPGGPGLQAGLIPGTAVTVEINFFVDTPLVDLDNLAKPVLDTLFVPNPNDNQEKLRGVAGVLFPIPDESVTRLVLTKTVVSEPSALGAEISASW